MRANSGAQTDASRVGQRHRHTHATELACVAEIVVTVSLQIHVPSSDLGKEMPPCQVKRHTSHTNQEVNEKDEKGSDPYPTQEHGEGVSGLLACCTRAITGSVLFWSVGFAISVCARKK